MTTGRSTKIVGQTGEYLVAAELSRREFAPYIGINWWKKFGGTEDLASAAGEVTNDFQWVIGIRAWF